MLYYFRKESAQRRWVGSGFLFLMFFLIQPIFQSNCHTTFINFQSMPYQALKRRRLIFFVLTSLPFNSVPSCKNSDEETSFRTTGILDNFVIISLFFWGCLFQQWMVNIYEEDIFQFLSSKIAVVNYFICTCTSTFGASQSWVLV